MRIDLAFKAFFRRVKAKDPEAGFPRFKGFGRYDSLTYPHYGNGAWLAGERVILSKVGAVAINLHRPVEGTSKTIPRKRNSTGKWYVSFATEQEAQTPDSIPEAAVGIDVGVEKFATPSTGEMIPNPRFFRRDARDLQRASRRLSAKEKGTPERV